MHVNAACATPPPLSFVGEQKDPFRMTVASFRAAADSYGLDAFDRLAMWGQLGARVLVFPYVQPSLTPGGAPDSTLFLRVLLRNEVSASMADSASCAVDPGVLREHLRRFFGISVAKGLYDPDSLPEVQNQMAESAGTGRAGSDRAGAEHAGGNYARAMEARDARSAWCQQLS